MKSLLDTLNESVINESQLKLWRVIDQRGEKPKHGGIFGYVVLANNEKEAIELVDNSADAVKTPNTKWIAKEFGFGINKLESPQVLFSQGELS